MAQNNDVLRPSRLAATSEDAHDRDPTVSRNQNSTQTLNLTDLKNLISELIKEESKNIVSAILNPESQTNNDIDQPIEVGHDLTDMDKIPDIVKSLRDFSGQPGQFSSWKKSVDRILRVYESLKGTPKYYGILNVIRNKITGDADIALESYNTPLDWEKIAKCLTLHYADKRDLGTLEYQMTTLVQKGDTIPEFYQAVYHHLSLILNKLSSMEMSQESLDIMTRSYRDKALDTFIRGLKGDLPRLLSIREPVDLPQALHLCLKLQNVDYRIQHSHGNIRGMQHQKAPPIPPKLNQFPINKPRINFYPQLLNNPQRTTTKPEFQRQNQNSYQPQRPFPEFQRQNQNFYQSQRSFPEFQRQNQNFYQSQRPFVGNNDSNPSRSLSRPEPMEIDNSMQSRRIDYKNRPQGEQPPNKRPPSQQIQNFGKFQRVFHTEQNTDELNDEEQYIQEITNHDENYDQTPDDYINSQNNLEFVYSDEQDDINFLD